MKHRSIIAVLFLLALCCTVVSALAQDKPKPPAAPPAMDEAMKAMEKAATPGEPQKRLARLAGDWTFTNTMWMAPGQPPTTSTGTMHGEILMDGRYVEHTWKGDMMGMPFHGRGTDGYDNVAKHYVSSWLDNMSTGIMYSIGSCDDAGKVCNYTADMWDPMSGKKGTTRSTITWMDDNSFKNEMYGPGPDGKEMKWMEIVAKRK
jgi:uncharacterized protein DUF1579